MDAKLLIGFLVCVLLPASFAQTTPWIAEVFTGKCYERNPTGVNCTELFSAFSSAAMLGNNILNDSYYEPFFALANLSTPQDNILFWSGNQAFALALANDGTRYTTVEETSTGYILNGLNWCGVPDASPPRFDYTNPCLYPRNATYYGTQGVWAQCSQRFAAGASGHVSILLQASQLNYNSGPYLAFRNTSVFYQIELPSLNRSKVTNATVLLISNKTLAPNEVCGSGTLLELNDMMQKHLNFTPLCVDDPQKIYEILCPSDSTGTAQCLAATLAYSESQKQNDKENRIFFIWAVGASAVALTLLFATVYFGIRAQRKGYSEIKLGN